MNRTQLSQLAVLATVAPEDVTACLRAVRTGDDGGRPLAGLDGDPTGPDDLIALELGAIVLQHRHIGNTSPQSSCGVLKIVRVLISTQD